MNRPILLLLRRSVKQLDLLTDSFADIGKRSAAIATHPFCNQINQFQYPLYASPNAIQSAPALHPSQTTQTLWIAPNKSPDLQKVANRLDTQPPERSEKSVQQQAEKPGDGRPPIEKQLIVYNTLRDGLPKLFTLPMDYRIYNKELIFINNLLGKTTKGLPAYIQQVSFLRTIGHFKFAFVRFEILNMSHDVDAARVTVRWRIIGVSGLKVMLKFWKNKLWKREELAKQAEKWYDGISYFDIGSDGLVWRHIADKLEEDKDRLMEKTKATPLAAKLALLAVILKPVTEEGSTSELSELFFSFFQ